MKELTIIRHGDTPGTLRKLFYGATDLPLADEGRADLIEFAAKGTYPDAGGAAMFTSGMLRTEQTLEVIYGDIPHETIPDLREIDLGKYEMKTFEQVQADRDGKEWLEGDMGYLAESGGDSMEGFNERVSRGIDTLIEKAKDHEKAIAVLHGAVIFTAMEKLFPDERDNPWSWVPKPGLGYTIYFEDGKPVRYIKLGGATTE
jgi:alpha-ribazole phosphatase